MQFLRHDAVVLLLCGCSSDTALSPAEDFNQQQAGTITPHGRVVPGSATDQAESRIRYQTDSGATFEVTAQPTGTGTYRYSDPRRIEAD